jgi:CRP-like cAMP-binding protein
MEDAMLEAEQAWEERVESMRSITLFAEIGRGDLGRLAAIATDRTFTAGEELVTQEQEGDSFYIITEGEAEVLSNGTHVATLRRGDSLGEMAVLRRMPHSASVRASTDVKALHITQWDLEAELRNTPGIAYRMLIAMSNRLHLANIELSQLQDTVYNV